MVSPTTRTAPAWIDTAVSAGDPCPAAAAARAGGLPPRPRAPRAPHAPAHTPPRCAQLSPSSARAKLLRLEEALRACSFRLLWRMAVVAGGGTNLLPRPAGCVAIGGP